MQPETPQVVMPTPTTPSQGPSLPPETPHAKSEHRFEPRLNPKRRKLEDDPGLHYEQRMMQKHLKSKRHQLDNNQGRNPRRLNLKSDQGLHRGRLRDRHPRRLKLEYGQGPHRRRLRDRHPRRLQITGNKFGNVGNKRKFWLKRPSPNRFP